MTVKTPARIVVPPEILPALERRMFIRRVENVPRAEFARFAVNRLQRNTADRVHAAAFGRLATLESIHLELIVAECEEDGVLYVVDGHTRLAAWESGLIAPDQVPEVLSYRLFRCKTLADVDALFTQVDAAASVKNQSDLVYGMLRSHGWLPRSPFLQSPGKLKDPIRRVMKLSVDAELGLYPYSHLWMHNLLGGLIPDLKLIDSLDFGNPVEVDGVVVKPMFPPACFVAAALLAVARDGDARAVDLLRLLRDGAGKFVSGRFDVPYALRFWLKSDARGRAHARGGAIKKTSDLCAFLTLYEMWRADPDCTMTDHPYSGTDAQQFHVRGFMKRGPK